MNAQDHHPTLHITDELLVDLSAPIPGDHIDALDDETLALLPVALSEICRELLAWRRAARTPPALCLWQKVEAVQARLVKARETVRSADPIAPLHLKLACETLLLHSPNPDERTAAAEVLSQIRVAA